MRNALHHPAQEEQRLYTQLATCPLLDLTGVVGRSGVWASTSPDRERWSVTSSFDAWRIGSSRLQTDPLTIRGRVPDHQLRAIQDTFQAEAVVRIRARVARKSNISGRAEALLEDLLGRDPADMELRYYSPEARATRIYEEDDRFGVLVHQRRCGRYVGAASWAGAGVQLRLVAQEPRRLAAALDVARALWDREEAWNRRARRYLLRELWPVENEARSEDGDEPIDPWQYLKRIQLKSITVCAEGDFELRYLDGAHHRPRSIELWGSLFAGWTRAQILE